ncbi:hypothetical protein Salat_1886700 [Sesamum alatum]|uniref:Uncharacterized protein n=1 Tax=Sesamum alatum TaxID=300844 RepID=A0AAE1Y3E5_9LAMI|nr:hypothetical protein Salat_1886700 [Sesamum alatum]
MNLSSLCNERASVPAEKVMACAAFVRMVGTLCFVMDAQGPSTKNVHPCRAFLVLSGIAHIARKFSGERYVERRKADVVAAGRVLGTDPIPQRIGGSISMIKNLEEVDVIACIICR